MENKSKKNEIVLILRNVLEGEDEFKTKVFTEEEITSYSISYDIANDETVAYAFESNAELVRVDGRLNNEEMTAILDDIYSFYILRDEQEVSDYYNREGDYENV